MANHYHLPGSMEGKFVDSITPEGEGICPMRITMTASECALRDLNRKSNWDGSCAVDLSSRGSYSYVKTYFP